MHHIIKNLKYSVLFFSFCLLAACSFFEKDNTPPPSALTYFRPEVSPKRLWSVNTGPTLGSEYVKMGPSVGQSAIFTASSNGTISSVNKMTGRINWRIATRLGITTAPGVGDHLVVVGTHKGTILALRQVDGRIVWKTQMAGEILARPAIQQGVVVVKAVGYLNALSATDGRMLWSYRQIEPNLVLRGASAPIIKNDSLVAGFANGSLAKLTLHDGQLLWERAIAFPTGAFSIQRMVDIDADPLFYDHSLYAATFQGKIASLDALSGNILWSHDISSYTGMAADSNAVYVSDANSLVWALGANNGLVNWRQIKLQARNISGPALMKNYIVVGDAEGYLHWLSKTDGHFVGRIYVGSAIYASPQVENNILYVLTNTGNLAAYMLS